MEGTVGDLVVRLDSLQLAEEVLLREINKASLVVVKKQEMLKTSIGSGNMTQNKFEQVLLAFKSVFDRLSDHVDKRKFSRDSKNLCEKMLALIKLIPKDGDNENRFVLLDFVFEHCLVHLNFAYVLSRRSLSNYEELSAIVATLNFE